MKTTIYTLLGMIKENTQPMKVKYKDKIYYFDNDDKDYKTNTENLITDLFAIYTLDYVLNEKVDL